MGALARFNNPPFLVFYPKIGIWQKAQRRRHLRRLPTVVGASCAQPVLRFLDPFHSSQPCGAPLSGGSGPDGVPNPFIPATQRCLLSHSPLQGSLRASAKNVITILGICLTHIMRVLHCTHAMLRKGDMSQVVPVVFSSTRIASQCIDNLTGLVSTNPKPEGDRRRKQPLAATL